MVRRNIYVAMHHCSCYNIIDEDPARCWPIADYPGEVAERAAPRNPTPEVYPMEDNVNLKTKVEARFLREQFDTKFDMPKFDMPKMEVPAAFREFAEKGVAQTKDAYEKMKAAAEESDRMLETATRPPARARPSTASKVIEIARYQHQRGFRLRREPVRREVAVRAGRAVDRACARAVRDADRAGQGAGRRSRRRSRPRPPSRSRPASPRR